MTETKQYPQFLVRLPGAAGAWRYFWQPSARVRREGWRSVRVPDNWLAIVDAAELEAAAIAKAKEINAEVVQQRQRAARAVERRGARAPAPVTLGDVILRYRASPDFRERRASTQRGYEQCLARLADRLGDKPLSSIKRASVHRLRHEMRATPAYANAVLRVLSLLFTFAQRQDWTKENPALDPGYFKSAPSAVPWPREAVVAFVETADAMGLHSVGTAVMLNEWLGQRLGDVIAFKKTDYRDGTLSIRQSKTGAGVMLPVALVPHLVERLGAEFRRHASYRVAPLHIIATRRNRPFTVDGFRKQFEAVRAKLAERRPTFAVDFLVPGRKPSDPDAFIVRTADLTFMHLRHTAVTRMADAGCEDSQVAAVTGHSRLSISKIIERYCARTREQARRAFKKRIAAEIERVEEAEAVALAERPLIEAPRGD